MGCVVVAEDNVDDLTDTQVLDDTTSAEDGMSGDATSATFELIGEWDTNYGQVYSITKDMWGSSTIQVFDNAANDRGGPVRLPRLAAAMDVQWCQLDRSTKER